jgi:protein-tyrosine phosphatase
MVTAMAITAINTKPVGRAGDLRALSPRGIMRVQFVCLGNICRSPTAHAVLRAKVQGLGWRVESAGTGAWHLGHPPDPRAVAEAEARGYPMADLRAEQFTAADFERFDLILAMDRSNLRDILALRPRGGGAEVALFLEYTLGQRQDVPDPYYNGGFAEVFDMIERGADALISSSS